MNKAFFAVMLVAILGSEALAAVPTNVYWDINGATAGGSGTTAAVGNWDTTTANWSTDSTGSVATQVWNNAGNNIAVFSAGTGVTAASAITVPTATPLTMAGITREEGSPTINDNAVGASPITFSDGANLAIDTGTGTLVVNAFYGTTNGVITKTGTGLFSTGLSQTTFAGKWVVNQGSLSVAGDTRLGVVPGAVVADQVTLVNGAKIRTSIANAAFTANRGITLNNGGGFDAIVAMSWAGPITGTGGLTQAGALGNVTLSNTGNNWSGDLTFTAGGTVTNGASGVIPDTAVVNTITGATYALGNFNETVKSISGSGGTVALGTGTLTLDAPNGETYSSSISGTGGGKLVKNGAGNLILSLSSGGYDGGMTLNAGKLGIGTNVALGAGTFTIGNNNSVTASASSASGRAPTPSAVVLNGNVTVDDTFTATPGTFTWPVAVPWTIKGATRTFNVNTAANNGYTVTITGAVGQDAAGRGITKTGNGILALNNAANTYSGPTQIDAGTVSLDSDGTLGDGTGNVILNGGTLNATADRTGSGLSS